MVFDVNWCRIASKKFDLGFTKIRDILISRKLPAYLAARWDVSWSGICDWTLSDARRLSCCLTQIARRESSAAKRYCDDDVCLMLTMSGSLTRKYSRSNHPSIPRMIACMIQRGRNRPLQVVVWSRAASTSVKAWWHPSLYQQPARHRFTLSKKEPR